ncbi:MAG: biotin--[acetyl-CoA-carboxylase] ligase [Gammaproteobacteria bacterium]|nr:biotin--[acetyl-CoA-carboxylase] ligase [Gammaproteobacteria bacterium]
MRSAGIEGAELPRAYELVELERVASVLDETAARAAAGADEGTLLAADEQSAARGRCGQAVLAPPGGLYLGLVLRPAAPCAAIAELATVAVVSLGAAMAELLSPMTELRYRWPNDVLLADAKAAAIQVRAPAGQRTPEWVVVGGYANVVQSPPELGLDAASLAVEGDAPPAPPALLAAFGRQFLAWVNRWAEEGFEPVRRAWSLRLHDPGTWLEVGMPQGTAQGTVTEIDADGALILKTISGGHRRLELARAHGLDDGAGGE